MLAINVFENISESGIRIEMKQDTASIPGARQN